MRERWTIVVTPLQPKPLSPALEGICSPPAAKGSHVFTSIKYKLASHNYKVSKLNWSSTPPPPITAHPQACRVCSLWGPGFTRVALHHSLAGVLGCVTRADFLAWPGTSLSHASFLSFPGSVLTPMSSVLSPPTPGTSSELLSTSLPHSSTPQGTKFAFLPEPRGQLSPGLLLPAPLSQ